MNTTTRLSLALAVTTAVVVAVVVYQEWPVSWRRVPDFSNLPAPKYANSPLVGEWEEIARIPCDGGPEYEPFNPIRELVFWAPGSFRLTMVPLETRYDYNGKFDVDEATKALRMFSFSGVYPHDIDGEGSYEIDSTNQLILHDVWLSRYSSEDPNERVPRACGHRFVPGGDAYGRFDGALWVNGMLDGRKDSSRRPRADGSFDTMENCYQPTLGASYGDHLYSERSTVTKAGTSTPVRGNFIYIVDRGKDERDVLVTFYEPTHPEKWLGSCGPDVRSDDLAYPERGRERCKLSLHREGDYEHQVWTGASKPGECASEFAGDAYMITEMRLDADAVEIWERGFDEQGNQTWGSEAPTHYEPATDAWPKPNAIVEN
ncbi:CpcT/CpeT family chromophore lyase [Enhygromyxa salina]|uniref:Chromophore lyase CpcT/CpeT n=1 Tax=Enhygromyxa salina TaxID=215803 RepID=A0A2S9YM94_9BACT|nr:CpcT/CpeT family chromophore lyase [Enhygromyxa salina]PRQ06207.1 Chromophore lyase CpcT/CpeT [Enhygromyxa salina]